jgi:hypothetical protein
VAAGRLEPGPELRDPRIAEPRVVVQELGDDGLGQRRRVAEDGEALEAVEHRRVLRDQRADAVAAEREVLRSRVDDVDVRVVLRRVQDVQHGRERAGLEGR